MTFIPKTSTDLESTGTIVVTSLNKHSPHPPSILGPTPNSYSSYPPPATCHHIMSILRVSTWKQKKTNNPHIKNSRACTWDNSFLTQIPVIMLKCMRSGATRPPSLFEYREKRRPSQEPSKIENIYRWNVYCGTCEKRSHRIKKKWSCPESWDPKQQEAPLTLLSILSEWSNHRGQRARQCRNISSPVTSLGAAFMFSCWTCHDTTH